MRKAIKPEGRECRLNYRYRIRSRSRYFKTNCSQIWNIALIPSDNEGTESTANIRIIMTALARRDNPTSFVPPPIPVFLS